MAGWGVRPVSMDYVPEGGGSHHWRVVDDQRQSHFVTVDDLDDKDWLGDIRNEVFDGLGSAFLTARSLRRAGLGFVVAPVAARDGTVVRRLEDRYAVSVWTFLAGHSYRFGAYPDAPLRDVVLDLVAALHGSTAVVRDRAPRHVLGYGGERDLKHFLAEPGRSWKGGPFSESTRLFLLGHLAGLTELMSRFDQLAVETASARVDMVITHGEPHPANLISVNGHVHLIDWDTTALAPRERDLALVVTADGGSFERYTDASGCEVDLRVITLYQLRWYLDDLGSAVRMFHHPHDDNPDTRRWSEGLAPQIEQLPDWLARLR